jgi:acyl-coenzyme A synthetase/AMP-(fatty) acid ligase
MDQTLAYLFDQTALQLDGKKAILFLRKGRLESQLTFSSLRQISNRVANALLEMGLRKGDRAILFMPKCMEQVVFHLGVQKIGAISVILNPGFKKDEMDYFLKDTDPQVVIVGRKEEALIRSIEGKRPILSVDTEAPFSEQKLFPEYPSHFANTDAMGHDPGLLIYTSGTTGQSKGAILTQRNLIQDAKNIIRRPFKT